MIWFLLLAGESIIRSGALATPWIKSGHARQRQSVMVVCQLKKVQIFLRLCYHRAFIQFWYYFWQIGDTVSYAGSDIEYFLRTGSYS